jgi:hypothetical protein
MRIKEIVMEVEYSLGPGDIKAFAAFDRRHKPGRTAANLPSWIIFWCLLVLLGLVLGVGVGVLDRLRGQFGFEPLFDSPGAFGLGIFVSIVVFLAFRIQGRLLTRKEVCDDPRNHWLMGPRQVQVGPEGVFATSAHHRTFSDWSIICLIGTTEEHLFLYIGTQQALIIPRRGFASPGDFEAFRTLAQRYHDQDPRAAREGPTGITTIPNVLPLENIQTEAR